MPVLQGDIPDAGVVLHALVGDKSDADAGGHQIQGGAGGIHGADDGFIGRGAGGPLLEALAHIVVEHHLWLAHHLPGVDAGPVRHRVGHRQGHEIIPLIELAEVEAPVPVGGVDDGHVQLLLADQIHEVFRGAFRQMEADALVFTGVLDDLPGQKTVQSSGDHTHADDDGGLGLAFPEDHGGGVELLDGFVHIFLVEAALVRQADVPAHLFKELHAAQGVFQIVNGTAEGRLGDAQPGGGGGFPSGRKWQFAKASVSDQKYVVCNGDEGDPGAFMDRSILEGNPYAVIEGMMIAGYAIGASEGYFYVRAEYPIAVNRLRNAIRQMNEAGILGENILGTGFHFQAHIRLGAGAFVCGEETALLNSIEGKRGMPRPRPPFPAVKGLWGEPTIVNNVETLACVPYILREGAAEFASCGTEKSKGTKVFALGGKVNNVGLVEIPMGTTLRELIYDIGGGIPEGKQFKAIQTGGPSGGCLTAEALDESIDFDNLVAKGSMMGSGGAIVMDEDNCMVDVAKFYMEFICDESCGKCSPCRIGTKRMLEILTRITEGNGTMEDLQELEELGNTVKNNSLCALGQTAANPIMSTLAHFRDEYIAHIVDKTCPAKVCKNLMSYTIEQDNCVGCGRCAKACPADAIYKTDYTAPGKKLPSYQIDAGKCVKCGACMATCKLKAIVKK